MPRVLAIFICACAWLSAEAVDELFARKLTNEIQAIEQRSSGVLGVAVIDLTSGRRWTLHEDTVFPQASSIKIPIMIEVFNAAREGRLKLSDKFTLQPSDSVGGSGHLRLLLQKNPLTLTVEELVAAMIQTSDNTATNRLIAAVGMDGVNASMEKLGFRNTKLRRIMMDSSAAARDDENVSTPAEMASIAELLYRGKIVDGGASTRMLDILGLVQADFRAAVPASVKTVSKPGGISGVRCETGIIYVPGRPFVLSVMSTYVDPSDNAVKAVAESAYKHFDKVARSNRYGHRVR